MLEEEKNGEWERISRIKGETAIGLSSCVQPEGRSKPKQCEHEWEREGNQRVP